MSESTVETTTSGPSLESILWAAAERWSDEPGLVDRDEFADYIFDVWGAESPSEEFVARFFDGDPTIARPTDMAEAVSRASRSRMHVYNFDLNRLEYVVIEDAEQVVLVSDQGQFALPSTDYVMRAIERAIIPGSTNAVGTSGQYDRKQDGTPRAYFVRRSGEIVAVDVDQISKTVQQMQLDLKPVFSPVIGDASDRLTPFKPTRTAMMPNREVDLLRQDKRVSMWAEAPARKRLVSRQVEASAVAAAGLAAPASADAAVLLLLPDGTLARPVIGSGSRWRDMVSDWTARAAMISVAAKARPDAVMDERRYAIQTDRVVAVFSGVRSSTESTDAPGELGFTSQTRGEAIAAARMLRANIRVLGDDDLAQAVLGGAQLVSGLAAPILADTQAGTGFWLQPEIFFQPSSGDLDYATREMSLRSAGYSNAALETQLAAPQQEIVAAQGATSDPWSNWALQAGGELSPQTALLNRDVEGGSVSGPADPSALALFARRGRNIGSAGDASGSGGAISALTGGPIRMPSERVIAFSAPDGTLVFQPQANTQVRLASVHRSIGDGDDLSPAASPSAPSPRTFSASIGTRSGAIPASALAALATALTRTAAASGYKLPRSLSLESADDAIPVGRAISSSLGDYAPQRSRAMLTESPQLTGTVGRMVLSMPFPSAGELVVGADLDEALQSWTVAPAIPVGDASSGYSGGGAALAGAWGLGGGMVGSALGGSVAGGLALQGSSSSFSGAPGYGTSSLTSAAFVSGGGSSSGSSAPLADTGGASYLVSGSSAGQAVPASLGAGLAIGDLDVGRLHGAALAQAQRASFALQVPAAADTLSSRAALARLPRLLARALGASGDWIPGAGTPLPQPVREFALSGPFDLPELAAIGAMPARDEGSLISTRVLNPGEEEISIPMPLWAQMGRGRLSSTDAVMASPRMRPAYAPPLGVYRLVSPDTVDFSNGAPASTPGIVTLQGPTELGLDRSFAGGVEASQLGGRFILGRIPLDDGETAVSRRGRIRIGAPLSSGDGSSSLAGMPGFAGLGAQSLAGGSPSGLEASDASAASSAGFLGGDAPSGQLVSASAPSVPGVPQVETPDYSDFSSASLAPSASGRPFASALRSALRMSDDVGGRVLPSASAPAYSSGAGWTASGTGGASGGGYAGAGMLSGQPMVGGGSGGFGSSGSATSSLVAGAPQGAGVASGAQAGAGFPSFAAGGSSGLAAASSSSTSSSGSSSAGITGLPPGAWSGAQRSDSGYTPWTYGSRFSPSEQSLGGVDLFSGSRLSRPTYPTLPAMLRFRYIGAPLWWTSSTGSWAGASDAGDGGEGVAKMGRSLRSGLSAANSAAAIWRSIFVSPGRQGAGGSSSGSSLESSDAGSMDQTWDRSADSMASLSSKMALLAVGTGGGATVASGPTAPSAGPETVYVAMDSSGRAGTVAGGQRSLSPSELSMRIVAAIPPSPPPLADMAAASSTHVEARPRHVRAGQGHGDEQKSGEEGMSRSKMEGSVDAIAQRIYHRIVRRLETDRERFGG